MFRDPVTLAPNGDTVLVTLADAPEEIAVGADEDAAFPERNRRARHGSVDLR